MTFEERGFKVGDVVRDYKGELYQIGVLNTKSSGKREIGFSPVHGVHGLLVLPEKSFCAEIDHEKYPDVKQKYRYEAYYESDGEKA